MKRIHTVRHPEDFKALADARRIRMLGWLAREALTVTQLADKLGELPATVHHHVKMLERAGLVELAHTREKSGILEKYYRAVAERIVADHEVGELTEPAAIALDAAGGALRAGLNRLDADRADLAYIAVEELALTRQQARELAGRLGEALAPSGGTPGNGDRWLALFVLYPVREEGG